MASGTNSTAARDAAGNGDSQPPSSSPSSPSWSAPSASVGDHLAQTLKDLARGEQTAAALEANLTNLESKLDELLASFDVPDGDAATATADDSPGAEQEREHQHGGGSKKEE
ncbi:hypothetical protein B0T26DRAFT_57640 [Lasiosphaeria miniovina]|uniref:Uncharacterized protein n=1 Tax=Lasiosphaeria miniovina TaxID=1954250 RepID=A0AA40EG80_9PEZI|nr:uncharacterized protein B0T26DRAFT_57640 [Lasiosphaeria miniovina]KAK0734163.1 hypothetical protein B0T26DRAFT_57640 [Lasiosphaeria miniovina]